MAIIKCVGCGNTIAGNVNVGVLAYTCPCGSHLFILDGKLSMPRSLLGYLAYKQYGAKSPLGVQESVPHIEYYTGYSEYMDDIKKDTIDQLKSAGSISEDECQECMLKKPDRVTKLQGALEEDDYWLRLSDGHLAAHFRVPIVQIREMKKKLCKNCV